MNFKRHSHRLQRVVTLFYALALLNLMALPVTALGQNLDFPLQLPEDLPDEPLHDADGLTVWDTGIEVFIDPGESHHNTGFVSCGTSKNKLVSMHTTLPGIDFEIELIMPLIPPLYCLEPSDEHCPDNIPLCDTTLCICRGVRTQDECESAGGHCDRAERVNNEWTQSCHLETEDNLGPCGTAAVEMSTETVNGEFIRRETFLHCCKGEGTTSTPGSADGSKPEDELPLEAPGLDTDFEDPILPVDPLGNGEDDKETVPPAPEDGLGHDFPGSQVQPEGESL